MIYNFKEEDAYEFARFVGSPVKRHGDELRFTRYCPYCHGGTGSKRDKDTFSINLRTGQFKCLRSSCGITGNMITLANAIGVRRTLRSRSFKGYLKEEERDVRAAEKNEIITILEACTNCRDQVLILLTSELGFRIGEILGIDYTKDIDYETHEIRVNFREDNENDARAKNAEERRGRLSDDTFEFLLYYIGEYWDILQKQEYLFINIKGDTTGKPMKVDSVYDMFERMEKKTGIKITPHMLRRYYANTRWESDWPLEMISQALGHKHLDTTIRYLNVLDDKLRTASQEFYRRYSDLYNVNQFLESRR